MTAPVALRPRAALSAELEALGPMAEDGSPFHQGARDALRWLLTGGSGPLTGARSDLPICLRAVVAELAVAETLLYNGHTTGHDYAAGLEHGIMWAESATPAPPSATPVTSRQPARVSASRRLPKDRAHGTDPARRGPATAPTRRS